MRREREITLSLSLCAHIHRRTMQLSASQEEIPYLKPTLLDFVLGPLGSITVR